MITLHDYTPADLEAVLTLFYETVHTVNAGDYSSAQLDAWAPRVPDRVAWQARLAAERVLLAEEDDALLGFASLDVEGGLIDHLYVHKDYQRRGIASALCDQLESWAISSVLSTEASLTAVPFFSARGYQLVRRQQVVRRGVMLANIIMKKSL